MTMGERIKQLRSANGFTQDKSSIRRSKGLYSVKEQYNQMIMKANADI